MELNYYKLLGVAKGATKDEIKKAYRKIAKKYHPDSNPGDEIAEKKFREATKAYDTLTDEKKRKEYDSISAMGQGSAGNVAGNKKPADKKYGSGTMSGFDFSNFTGNFEQFFGFHPEDGQVSDEKLNPNRKTKTNPIDMTEMFERYMNMRK